MAIKILAVEDCDQFQMMIKASFSNEPDYQAEFAGTANIAIQMLEQENYDIFVIDIGLPDMDGFQLCSFIKSHPKYSTTPVVFLTGKDSIDDKETGFSMGADDYLTKPFHVRELFLRVKSLVYKPSADSGNNLNIGQLVLKMESHRVFHRETQEEISLTKTEFQLLTLLGRNLDKVISRERILDQVWPNKLDISERTIDSHMSNLRKKTSGCGITLVSVHSSGYRLEVTRVVPAAS